MTYKNISDSYHFECTLCANCCTGDTQILLDFFDLYKMSRFLNFSHSGELFKKNYVFMRLSENDIWRPQLRFKKKPFSFCPFLSHQINEEGKIGGLCSLHPQHKPLVCATAPIGRRYDFQADSIEYIFHAPAPDCPGIHSKKLNYIDDLDRQHEKEFDYQQITFRILANIPPNYNTQTEMQRLFSFPIDNDFDKIINEISERAGISL